MMHLFDVNSLMTDNSDSIGNGINCGANDSHMILENISSANYDLNCRKQTEMKGKADTLASKMHQIKSTKDSSSWGFVLVTHLCL